MSCMFCGEAIDREDQQWRIVDVTQPGERPSWEPELQPPDPGDGDYLNRLGELDGYPAHLACLHRAIADDICDDAIFRSSSR
jgi:hypothetical protein